MINLSHVADHNPGLLNRKALQNHSAIYYPLTAPLFWNPTSLSSAWISSSRKDNNPERYSRGTEPDSFWSIVEYLSNLPSIAWHSSVGACTANSGVKFLLVWWTNQDERIPIVRFCENSLIVPIRSLLMGPLFHGFSRLLSPSMSRVGFYVLEFWFWKLGWFPQRSILVIAAQPLSQVVNDAGVERRDKV